MSKRLRLWVRISPRQDLHLFFIPQFIAYKKERVNE
jgi:hypothetical protein